MAADLPLEKSGYDELPDGVLVTDGSGRVVLVNEAGRRILRCPADGLVGRDLQSVLPLVDPTGRSWWECTDPFHGLSIRKGAPERQLTLSGGPQDGRQLLVSSRYVREPGPAGPNSPGGRVIRVVVSFRDTVARDRQERNRADLVSTVAHELRSPLTSVKGFTATLLAKWERFTDDQKRLMLQTVNADADRVTRLISELLDVSRIDSGRLELRRQVVDVPAAVRKTFASRVAAGESQDRFQLQVDGELPEMWVDPDKLDQVLGNLVENAIRHGDGTVTVTVGPTHTEDAEQAAAVTVTDQGGGLSPEAAARVFTRFWRQGRRGGTGLGLYIVKGLVEAHGGTIEAGRGPDGGAAFRFVLPAGTPGFAV